MPTPPTHTVTPQAQPLGTTRRAPSQNLRGDAGHLGVMAPFGGDTCGSFRGLTGGSPSLLPGTCPAYPGMRFSTVLGVLA